VAQRFFKGDVVRLAEQFPPYMEHFEGQGKIAVVVGSYKDLYQHGSETEFCLNIEGIGEVSWFPDFLMTLIVGQKNCPTCNYKLRRF
jgi:hypothetical protein